MDLITAILKNINKDNWVVVLLSIVIFFMGSYIVSTISKKPFTFSLGPIQIKLGSSEETKLQEQALTQSEKIKIPHQAIIVDRVKNYVTFKEKQITKLYYDVMVRQMNFCDERMVEIKGIFVDEYSKLLSKKISKDEDVRVHPSFRNYKMFISLVLEYAIKEATYKKSVRQNHLAEFTIESWDAFIEQKTNTTLALINDEYDMNFPDDSLVTRKEVDESNERIFDKIRPIIVSMYRKARDISIETRGKIKMIEIEMDQYLKSDIVDSGNLSDEIERT
jgi:hypothetical protein